jgi:PAS domain-containing protein
MSTPTGNSTRKMSPFLSALRPWRLLALEKASLYSKVTRELAERKKAEARIRESEHRYRNFLESSPDPIVVYNMEGVATYVNPAFEQTFSMSRKELLGKQIDFVPPETWPETRAAIKPCSAARRSTCSKPAADKRWPQTGCADQLLSVT